MSKTFLSYFVVSQETEVLHARSDVNERSLITADREESTSYDQLSCETHCETSSARNDLHLSSKHKKGVFSKLNIIMRRMFSSKLQL